VHKSFETAETTVSGKLPETAELAARAPQKGKFETRANDASAQDTRDTFD
jgi:hypothetical protein